MSVPTCPTCDNPMVYAGIDDGGGDYGTAVCDIWTCQNCMQDVEMNCVETEDDDMMAVDDVYGVDDEGFIIEDDE